MVAIDCDVVYRSLYQNKALGGYLVILKRWRMSLFRGYSLRKAALLCGSLEVIRFRLKELIAEKAFNEDRVITISEVSKETEIHRATLSKIANERGYNTGTENIDKLCRYFDFEVSAVIEYISS